MISALLVLALQDTEGLEHFEKAVRPLLAERCYSCHSAQSEKLKGNLRLDTPERLKRGGDRGPAVEPGHPDRSLLIQAVRWTDEDLRMPPKRKLAPEEVAVLESWIRRGAPLPGESKPKVEGLAASNHWAFQPPRNPPLPAVRHPEWVRTPVDRFILAALEGKGLSPAPPADRRALLRRTTYTLTGLPPAPEEIEDFLADDSHDAFARVVDRLLASPRYGERWGRHWLDVARYADTKGYTFREEAQFVHSRVYRDWVIRAFNEDLPFDRFLLLQLAADQVATDRRDLAAMGFLTVGRGFTKVVHEIIDDRIDVVTRGLLGLTATCARCHDHKYDPIPTEDYYSLYGVFAGSLQKTVRLDGTPGTESFERELLRRQERLESYLRAKREQLLDRARAKIAEYLLAALDAERLPSEQFFEMLGPDDVNPALVRRVQSWLQRARSEFHPVFAVWQALADVPEGDLSAKSGPILDGLRSRLHPRVAEAFAGTPPASMREVAARYGRLLAMEELRPVLRGPGSPVSLPEGSITELQWFFDDDTRNELGRLEAEIDRWLLAGDRDHAVILEDKPAPEYPRVFRRGNPSQRGPEVPRRFLAALSGPDRRPFEKGSGRLELARAIVSPSNPLAARVWVNRVWAHHFGAGLVRTPSDFGTRGEPPTHPELLDYLAIRFVEEGWSVKQLHRLILLSSVAQQSSEATASARAIDPDNRLFGRMNRRRLDFEALRDSMLAASGQIDLAMGGPSVDLTLHPSPPRRSVYGFVDRLNLPGMYRTFDFANPDMHSPERHSTSVPQQALYLLNSPFVQQQARTLAARAGGDAQALHRFVYGRPATPGEVAAGLEYVAAALTPPPAPPGPWSYGMPYFSGKRWQAEAQVRPGQAMLTATGGVPGEGPAGAVVRRWTAPRAGTLTVSGTIAHREREGDGIRARILAGGGEIAAWTVKQLTVETKIDGLKVKAGEEIDFVVDCRSQAHEDEYSWSAVIRMAGAAKDGPSEWNSAADFRGPAPAPLSAWERYAQILLLSNEFHFLE